VKEGEESERALELSGWAILTLTERRCRHTHTPPLPSSSPLPPPARERAAMTADAAEPETFVDAVREG